MRTQWKSLKICLRISSLIWRWQGISSRKQHLRVPPIDSIHAPLFSHNCCVRRYFSISFVHIFNNVIRMSFIDTRSWETRFRVKLFIISILKKKHFFPAAFSRNRFDFFYVFQLFCCCFVILNTRSKLTANLRSLLSWKFVSSPAQHGYLSWKIFISIFRCSFSLAISQYASSSGDDESTMRYREISTKFLLFIMWEKVLVKFSRAQNAN